MRTPRATTPMPTRRPQATGNRNWFFRLASVDLRQARSGPDAGQEQQDQPDRRHPFIEERRPDRQPLAGDRFAQRREHRGEEDEERAEEQDPVVDEKRRLARHPRVQLVPRAEQREPPDHQPEADRQEADHEDREHPGELPVLAERVHRLDDPRARHERTENGQEERHDDERDVPDAEHPPPLLHHHRVQERRRRKPRQQPGVLDRIPHPVTAPAQLLVRPEHAERQPERQEEPGHHRPAPDRAEPRVVQVAGRQRRDPERERDRHPDEADVERRRVDRHVEVLQQRAEPAPVAGRLRDERLERVVVDHHQEDEEHLHEGDRRDNVRDQLAVALAVDIHRDRPEGGQQEHPEHDRAVQPAPVRRQLVEEGLCGVGVPLDVLDRIVVGRKGVNDQRRGHRHQRRDEVKRADAALDEARGSPPRPRHRAGYGITADDEGRQQDEGP